MLINQTKGQHNYDNLVLVSSINKPGKKKPTEGSQLILVAQIS